MIAMEGKNYFESAEDAYYLVERNKVQFASLHSLGSMFTFLGQSLIAIGTGLGGYLYLNESDNDIKSPFTVCVLLTLLGYLVGSVFMKLIG
jgi:hypothetical protein